MTKELFRQYQVQATSVEDFLDKYYKHDRYKGRNGLIWGNDYSNPILKTAINDFLEYGWCIISKHDSNTGRVVSFYGELTTIKGR